MRLILIGLGRTLLDVRIAEPDDDSDDEPTPREGWPVDSSTIADVTPRIGYVDDVGVPSYHPYE
jgi:hypothetical protein